MDIVTTQIPGFSLRSPDRSDVPSMLQFIHELAAYEKLIHEVKITEEDLTKALFGERPMAEAVLGYQDELPVAFALFFSNFSTFTGRPTIYLEDLFVKEDHRGRGYGTVLLAYLARLARERNCARFEWTVLNWNQPAIDFYRSIGAVPMREWTVQRVSGDALQALADQF